MNNTVKSWSRVVGVCPGTTEKQRRTAWRIRRWKTNRHVQCHFGFTPGEILTRSTQEAADYLGMGPRAGGGAGIINYQPGPAGRPAGRGGTTLT